MKNSSQKRADATSHLTAGIVSLASKVSYELLPADIVELARQCIIDWLAVAIAGSREPLATILGDEIEFEGGAGRASVVCRRGKVSASSAALLNGAASHALDYDDVNLSMAGHPSVAVLPAVLAAAELEGASGRDIVAAFVAGYETVCRIGALVSPGHYAIGFHNTGTVGTFGAAVGAAHIAKAGEDTIATALGIAGTQAAGLKSLFGTMCKPLHAGRAAQNGLAAARLAARGFTARPDILECEQGFAATHGPDFDSAAALTTPAGGYHLRNNLFKYHAACYLTHSSVEALRSLRERQELKTSEIGRVTIRTAAGNDRVCNIRQPRTGLEVKFSLRHMAAFAVADVDTAGLESYTDENAARPDLVSLRERIETVFEPGWPTTKSVVEVETRDGRNLVAGHDSGVPATDLALQRRRLEAKFRRLVEPELGAETASNLLDAAGRIEQLAHVEELMAFCRTHSRDAC